MTHRVAAFALVLTVAAHSTIGGATAPVIPDVVLQDQEGRSVRAYSDVIKGRLVVMNFIFTSCTTVCSPMGANFAALQSQLGPHSDVALVSLSLDPLTDTPQRLKQWSERFGARPGWTLLTGSKDDVDRLLAALRVSSPNRRGAHADGLDRQRRDRPLDARTRSSLTFEASHADRAARNRSSRGGGRRSQSMNGPVAARLRPLWTVAGAVAICAPLLAAGDGALSPVERQGREVFMNGVGTAAIVATLDGDTRVPASVLPCGSCHGRDGRGRREGGVAASDISHESLARPYAVTTATGRRHGPYDTRLLRRAVTLGIDADGNPLARSCRATACRRRTSRRWQPS